MKTLPVYSHTVQYYETDRMKVVHHSNYIRWFEEARISVFEKIGLGYRHMEDIGIISPVVSVSAEYKTMTDFGDTVDIYVKFIKYTGVRLVISYEVKDSVTDEIRCTGTSSHCFIDRSGKIISLRRSYPEYDLILREYLPKEGD